MNVVALVLAAALPTCAAARDLPTDGAISAGRQRVDLFLLGFRWPIVGALLGSNYDDRTRTPISQNQMTPELFASLTRRANRDALAMLEKSGYTVSIVDELPVPQRHPAADFTLRGRIFEFSLNTTGRSSVRRVEVSLSVFWDLVDARTGGVIYTKEFRAEDGTELVGDRLGAFVLAVSRAFGTVFAQLVTDEEFRREVAPVR